MKLVAACILAFALAGCGAAEKAVAYHGDDPLPSGGTVKDAIEARQHNMKDMGGAFKAANDQLKRDAPQLTQIRFAVDEVKNHSQEIGAWFPAGTGPESGVKTGAKAVIWTDEAGFKASVQKFADAAAATQQAASGEDVAAIRSAVQTTAGTCKSCHDQYRNKED